MIWDSLRSKLAFTFFLVAVTLVGLAIVIVGELQSLERRISVERTATGSFDLVREVRDHENRYFLFERKEDFQRWIDVLDRTQDFINNNLERLESVLGHAPVRQLRDDLIDYRERAMRYAHTPHLLRSPDNLAAEAIRGVRKRMLSEAESLSRSAQQVVERGLEEQRTFMGIGILGLVVLMTGVAQFLIRRLILPLKSIERQMEQVASGSLQRVAFSWSDQELISLAKAFNHVMNELERRRAAEVQAEKLAALGTMLSGVAHELNNPLSNISTSIQIIAEELDQMTEAQLRPLIARIDQQTERARAIVRTLLEHARANQEKTAPVELCPLLAAAIEAVNHGRPQPRYVMQDCLPGLSVHGNTDRLLRMLINLLENAVDATADEEPIALTARSSHLTDGRLSVEIAVQDCGTGMNPEQRRHAFDPFYTTKPAGKGTGLGLFIAHDIVRQHGGTLQIISQPGTGTSITAILPTLPTHRSR